MGPQERNGRDHPIRNHIARTYGETPANRAAERASLQRCREDTVRSTGGVVIDGALQVLGSPRSCSCVSSRFGSHFFGTTPLWPPAAYKTMCRYSSTCRITHKQSMLESASVFSEETAELLCPAEEEGEQLPPQTVRLVSAPLFTHSRVDTV
ncbi:hypothetical protein C8R47DRAFT_966694 [Mycena vitilis]|nr:hypothetical protein C8R47DRAFT_966694 [Mycena vitilis]